MINVGFFYLIVVLMTLICLDCSGKIGFSLLNSTLADDNAVPADQPNSVLGSSETRHEQPYGKLETAILPSETGKRRSYIPSIIIVMTLVCSMSAVIST